MNGNEPLRIPIDGTLDLHAFNPRDVKVLVVEYLRECRKRNILDVRIIHGKGTGTMRATVRALLERLPEVCSFETAGTPDGGWGATMVVLFPGEDAKERSSKDVVK